MKLYIRNMVCHRCKLAVQTVFKNMGLTPTDVELGEVTLAEARLTTDQELQLKKSLEELGFELLDDRRKRMIEQVKAVVIEAIHHSDEPVTKKYSALIQEKLHHDYSHLSNLFSEVEGITIEQYIIRQKIEKVKELLVYDELSLNEIADHLGYSSAAHVSAQFKKVTGLTPSAFRKLSITHRKPLDGI